MARAGALLVLLAITSSCSTALVLRPIHSQQRCSPQGLCEPCSAPDQHLPQCQATQHQQRLVCQLTGSTINPGPLQLAQRSTPAAWSLVSSTSTQAIYAVSCKPGLASISRHDDSGNGDTDDDSPDDSSKTAGEVAVVRPLGRKGGAESGSRELQAVVNKEAKKGSKLKKHRKKKAGKMAAQPTATKTDEKAADADNDEDGDDDEGEEVELESVNDAEGQEDAATSTTKADESQVKPGAQDKAVSGGSGQSQQATAVSKLEGAGGEVKMHAAGEAGKQQSATTQPGMVQARSNAPQSKVNEEHVVQVESLDEIEQATSGHPSHGWTVWSFELTMLSLMTVSLPVVYWRKLRIRHL